MRTPKSTAFGSFGYGWEHLWKYFLHLFLISIIVSVAYTPLLSLLGRDGNTAGFAVLFLIATAYWLLVLPVISYGGSWMYLRFVRDERANVADIFRGFKTSYLNIVLAELLVAAICGIGVMLFLIPGIILGCRLSFVPYLVMDKGLDPVAAIEKSWFMTSGHGWRIFAMYLLAIVMTVVGMLFVGVGALFATMWARTAFASLYHAVDLEDQARLNQNGVAVAAA